MKKLLELAKANPKVAAMLIGAVLLSLALAFGIPKAASAINESRINQLEADKATALQERDAARANDLILQGRIQAKDEVIKDLTSRIADSNQQVTNAHNETQTARANVNKVRSDRPQFNATDDAGRVKELGTELRGLYPDSP